MYICSCDSGLYILYLTMYMYVDDISVHVICVDVNNMNIC